ncbi:unnamed protein product [Caenorhabditis auriculariae]|uniref:Uncharacterized protein n=1 Tax=Caenorhabditis auriculariae TaxID=2777116 RepID=A0A8S1GUW5_9PELO|nr:unnamed protein product [Caenorhabditis auriculariae]
MSAEERRLELERKKQKLAELKIQRQRAQEQRTRELLNTAVENGNSRPSLSSNQVEEILNEVGIPSEPNVERPSEKVNGTVDMSNVSPMASQLLNSSRMVNLEFSAVQSFTLPLKDASIYSKTTQTDDEKFSVGEFSMGSQEFDYDDELGMDNFRGRAHSHDLESPIHMNDDIAKLLPGYPFANQKEPTPAQEEEKEDTRPRVLSEEERNRILASADFQAFFEYSSKVLERGLTETVDIFIDYARDQRGEVVASDDRLRLSRVFSDEKWTANRAISGITFSEQHPELMAVSYDLDPESVIDPPGVVIIWNTKFKKESPEYVVSCQSRITSVTFARFHAHLVLAGCYSGQICVWDNRIANKKTPINISPLSLMAHTHPVYSLAVIGTNNAHNLVSISTDGRMCSWNVDNLTQPVDGKELMNMAGKQIPCMTMSFPVADMNNFVVGSEDGKISAISRHGAAQASAKEFAAFEGHSAPVTSVAFHRATGAVDFSHLFLSASVDWTVKLWSTKDPQLRFSFESHCDFVYDAAWSPVHPAVFTSIDAEGNLFLWNLNEDTEGPVARMQPGKEGSSLRKVCWSDDGRQVCVGDNEGNVYVYEVHESMYVLRSEEWTRFARVLGDMKQASEDADDMSEVMSRLSNSGPMVNVSPRQNWP